MKSSRAKWNILAGHHPGYNTGQSSELLNGKNENSTNNSYVNIDVVIKFLAGLNTQLRNAGASPFDAYFNGHSHYYGRVMETVDSGKGIGLGIPSFTIGNGGKVIDDMYPVAYGDSVFNYNYDDGSPLELTPLEDIKRNVGNTAPISAGTSGWTAKLIDSKEKLIDINGKVYQLSIPVYTNGMGKTVPNSARVFGTTGAGPYGITVDASGTVYTANTDENTVTMLLSNGISKQLGTTGGGPEGIAIDSIGNIYTANSKDATVTKITVEGLSSVFATTENNPAGITVDTSNNVYEANAESDSVTIISPMGMSRRLGTTTAGGSPRGIVLDTQGNVYTANFKTNDVTRITPQGQSSTYGLTGLSPVGIAIDQDGNIYTANYNSNSVTKITTDGKSTTLGNTDLNPRGITVDNYGNVFVANSGSTTLTQITATGQSSIIQTDGSSPRAVALDQQGNLYASDNSSIVSKVDTGSDISGLYGYGSGAAKVTADKDYLFTHYQTIETLHPAIVRIAKLAGITEYQRGSQFYERWSPRSARLNDLALFSFNVKVDKEHPSGYLTDFTTVNHGNGYFKTTSSIDGSIFDDEIIDFEINGNNPINPLAQDVSDPTRALVRLRFQNGQLQDIQPNDLIRAGTDYRNLLNAINVTNYDYTAIPDEGFVTKVPLLIGININLEAQTTFADQGENYQDWYLTTETAAVVDSSDSGQFGALKIAVKPKSIEAQNLIATTPITTGYGGKDYQQKYAQAQNGTIDLIDSLSQNIGRATIINGIADISLSTMAAPGNININFRGDPTSSYLINFKPSSTKLSLNYGNWRGIVQQNSENKMRFDAPASNLSVIRMDDYEGLVDFGMKNENTSINLLKNAGPASKSSIGVLGGYSNAYWLATEGQALGSNGSLDYSLAAGDWMPSATLGGVDLSVISMSLAANIITVNFQGGIVASYGLPGTGSMIKQSESPSKVEVTIQRLGSNNNGLAFYEADPITGAVGGLVPGQVGYLIAALANAKSDGLLLEPSQLPNYGQSLTFDSLPIVATKNYGILLLVNGKEDSLFCSYSLANPYGTQQFVSLGSIDRGLTVGIEDISLFRNSDRDFNDLIVKFTSTAPLVVI